MVKSIIGPCISINREFHIALRFLIYVALPLIVTREYCALRGDSTLYLSFSALHSRKPASLTLAPRFHAVTSSKPMMLCFPIAKDFDALKNATPVRLQKY